MPPPPEGLSVPPPPEGLSVPPPPDGLLGLGLKESSNGSSEPHEVMTGAMSNAVARERTENFIIMMNFGIALSRYTGMMEYRDNVIKAEKSKPN